MVVFEMLISFLSLPTSYSFLQNLDNIIAYFKHNLTRPHFYFVNLNFGHPNLKHQERIDRL